MAPTLIFLPEESHGQCSLAEYGPWGHKKADTTEVTAHIHMHDNFLITFITPANSVLTIFPAIFSILLHPFQPPPATYSKANASYFGLLLQKHCTSLY